MDTQDYMTELVAQQTRHDPTKILDPQVSLLIEMNRKADLSSRSVRVKEAPDETEGDEKSVSRTSGDNAADLSTLWMQNSSDAVAEEPHTTEPESVVAAVPLADQTASAVPEMPAATVFTPAEPAEPFVEITENATPQPTMEAAGQPAEAESAVSSPGQDAEVELPPELFTDPAVAVSPLHDRGVQMKTSIEGDRTSHQITPDALPFDFTAMLESARNQVDVPDVRSDDGGILHHLPGYSEIEVVATTEYAEQKLAGLSSIWKQWERNI